MATRPLHDPNPRRLGGSTTRRAIALAAVLLLAACGGADDTTETADDIATLESTEPSVQEREEAAEPTTTSEVDESGSTAGDTPVSTESDDSTDATPEPSDAATGDDTSTEAEPLSEDDAQDILNDFSACMRTQGYDEFPDIVVGGGGARQIMDAGIDPRDDAFGDAFAVCGDGLDQLQSDQPQLSPEEQLTAEAALLAGAECMRESGYENFPDPDFTQGYTQQAYVPGLLASGIDIMSPEFRDAGQECSRRITDEFELGDN